MTFGHEGWGVDQELAAETVEMLHGVQRLLAASRSKRAKRVEPLKIPRPAYMKPTKKKPASAAQALLEVARGLQKGG